MNKLTVNSQFLTIEQAKELKGLGIDFSDANFAIGEDNDLIILGCSRDKRYCPTLSVSEMIEMLPEYTSILIEAIEKNKQIIQNNVIKNINECNYSEEITYAIEKVVDKITSNMDYLVGLLKQNKENGKH